MIKEKVKLFLIKTLKKVSYFGNCFYLCTEQLKINDMTRDISIIRGTIREAINAIEDLNFNGLQRNIKNKNGLMVCKQALEVENDENITKALNFIASNDDGFKWSSSNEKTAYFCSIAKILIGQ